jgi:hypothetical protein
MHDGDVESTGFDCRVSTGESFRLFQRTHVVQTHPSPPFVGLIIERSGNF